MNRYASAYYSPLYRGFKALDKDAYRAMVHYYEKNETAIQQLEFEEYFDLLLTYGNALFESGEFQKNILLCEIIIETSICQNIITHAGEDVLQQTLFQKATSHYRLSEYEKAIYVLNELLRIHPFEKNYIQLLKKCFRAKEPPYLQPIRAISIASFLLTALIIAVEMVVVRSLYPDYTSFFEKTRNLTFVFGTLLFVLAYLIHFTQSELRANRIVRLALQKF